jgi:serine/threonine protein kinase
MKELRLKQCRLDERYDILDCLGRGSYSEIYTARDNLAQRESLHRVVVIKALNLALQGTTDAELERTLLENFQNEARALDRVRHPNIISRLGHGTAIDLDGTVFHYLVLEYLSGGDLAAICKQGPLEINQAMFYLEQVCSGLAYAHERGVIHRDIKPQNLLLTSDGQVVKIADFGVAKLEAGEGAITRVGTDVFAPPAHSPLSHSGPLEGANGERPRQLTPAADIYSLAKTVFTLLAGVSPRRFSHHQITGIPGELAGHSWSRAVCEVLTKATHDAPERRYQTVQDFWDDLADAVLPATLELPDDGITDREPLATQTLSEVRQMTAQAPPSPRFESSRDYHPAAAERPRIVVAVAEREPPPPLVQTNGQARAREAQDILRQMPDADAVAERKLAAVRNRANSRWIRVGVGMLLLALFAGMLAITYSYFVNHRLWPSIRSGVNPGPNDPNDPTGREGITLTDVNLRSGPGRDNSVVGLAEANSRIRVLSVNGDWWEVQVLQHGKAKRDPSSSDRGWMIRKTSSGPTVNLN